MFGNLKGLWLFCSLALVGVFWSDIAHADEDIDPLRDEIESYWSVDLDLPVVVDKLYSRSGRFGVGLYTGMLSSEPFYWYVPLGGRLSYFLNDHVGFELGGQLMDISLGEDDDGHERNLLTHRTEIHDFFLADRGAAFNSDLHLEDRFRWRANATLLWNPLYGKWSFLNNKLTHFDFNLAFGGGVLQVSRPDLLRQNSLDELVFELVWGGGIHFFFSRHFTLRLDGRFYTYLGAPSQSVGEGFFDRIRVPAEFQLGATWLF